jgi:hypothetical protein
MPVNKVMFYLQTADRTRKAQVTLPRSMRVADVVKASAHRWFMSRHIDYQVANVTTGNILLAHEQLAPDRVHNGDVLMIQPFPTHGGTQPRAGMGQKSPSPAERSEGSLGEGDLGGEGLRVTPCGTLAI